MKLLVRYFFKFVRILMYPVMLAWEFVTTPNGKIRPSETQQNVDQQCRSLVLYQFKTCPFCIRVRREMHRLSLPIELRDAQKNLENRAELLNGGGQIKVPCLQITNEAGDVQWMYESAEIIQYLHQKFASV